MPLEIVEIVVTANVTEGSEGRSAKKKSAAVPKEELIAECVEKVLEILEEKKTTIMSGKLEKLIIEPFTDADCTVAGEATPYTVLINPDQIVMESTIEYETPQNNGGDGEQQIFKGIKSPKLDIKLLFDGTGVLLASEKSALMGAIGSITGNPTPQVSLGTVIDQLNSFRAVTNYYNGTEHEPGYVRIAWGIVFKGRLENFKVTYTLFKPDGDPLRATGEASFVGTVDPVTENKKKNNQSPDLTHVRIVKHGDTLPLMCHRIYKDPTRYLEIARVNKLSNYRKLEPGMKLFFPPIKLEK